MTDSAIGGVPTSGTDAAGDGSHDEIRDGVTPAEDLADDARVTAEHTATLGGDTAAPTDPPVDGAVPTGDQDRLATELAERTADLQRVSAEYANFRRRVERDRESTIAGAKAQFAGELLTVLDDVDRAAAHGDLTGGFKVVADRLTETLERVGLAAFGAEGDAFDPAVHEAVAQETSTEVSGPTVTTVMRRGYRFGERVLRPAMVAVTDRDPDAPGPPTGVPDATREPDPG